MTSSQPLTNRVFILFYVQFRSKVKFSLARYSLYWLLYRWDLLVFVWHS